MVIPLPMIHMTYEFGGRIRSEVTVRCTFGFAHVLARQAVGLESWGTWVGTLYAGMVPGYTGTFGYDSYATEELGRRQVVTALSVLCNPPRSHSVQEFVNVRCWSRYWPADLPVISSLTSSLTCITYD